MTISCLLQAEDGCELKNSKSAKGCTPLEHCEDFTSAPMYACHANIASWSRPAGGTEVATLMMQHDAERCILVHYSVWV